MLDSYDFKTCLAYYPGSVPCRAWWPAACGRRLAEGYDASVERPLILVEPVFSQSDLLDARALALQESEHVE